MTKEKKITIISGLVIGIVIILWIIFQFLYKNTEEKIKSDYSFTIGEITGYTSPTSELPRAIIYDYCVNDTKYDETIIVSSRFDLCKDFGKCKGKKYWVIYLNSNPKDCMIDLSKEIQNEIFPKPPKNLENFEYSTYRTIFTFGFKKKKKCSEL
jgi:hypothetical protein